MKNAFGALHMWYFLYILQNTDSNDKFASGIGGLFLEVTFL